MSRSRSKRVSRLTASTAVIAATAHGAHARTGFQTSADPASSQSPTPTSTQAPATSSHFTPSNGRSTSAATDAPTIDPSVLTAYTRPMARSPPPAASSVRVMRGSVTPAQKVAGSMTASEMPYLATLKIRYASSFIPRALSSVACQWKLAMYTGSVATARSPIVTCTNPSVRSGSVNRSARARAHSAPAASPVMKAESISSNECVAAPSTSASIRIHAISYTNEATAVPAATASSARSRRTRAGVALTGSPSSGSRGASPAVARVRCSTSTTTSATSRLRAAAA